MTEIKLQRIRDSESRCPLLYSTESDTWLTGDCLGAVHSYKHGFGTQSGNAAELFDQPIFALAPRPDGHECSIAYGNSVDIRKLPNIADEVGAMVVRGTLDVTHLHYDSDGQHM